MVGAIIPIEQGLVPSRDYEVGNIHICMMDGQRAWTLVVGKTDGVTVLRCKE